MTAPEAWSTGGLCDCTPSTVSTGVAIPTGGGMTASLVSCRLEEINGFFARNNEEYLALIFEKEGSYLGREVSRPQGPCSSWIALGREPGEFRSRAVEGNRGISPCTSEPSTGLTPAGRNGKCRSWIFLFKNLCFPPPPFKN